jgi:epoxide hydrolase
VARARDHAGNGDRADAAHDGMPVIRVPTGVAAFPKENSQVPRRFCEQYFDYLRMPKGGHVAPVEQPEALAGELRAFLSAL